MVLNQTTQLARIVNMRCCLSLILLLSDNLLKYKPLFLQPMAYSEIPLFGIILYINPAYDLPSFAKPIQIVDSLPFLLFLHPRRF